MPGRPAKPTATHKLTGTYKPSKHGRRADALGCPPLTSNEPPGWLSDRAKGHYQHLLEAVARPIMSDSHVVALATLATAIADFDQLNAMQRKARGEDELRIIAAKGKVYDVMLRYAREFGLTPLSAARTFRPIETKPAGQSEADAYFGPRLAK